jgi:antitoxin ParD1/3/4
LAPLAIINDAARAAFLAGPTFEYTIFNYLDTRADRSCRWYLRDTDIRLTITAAGAAWRTGVGFSPIPDGWSSMRTTRQLSITLPNDMADALRERVRSGEYASESEVIREGLRALFARDHAVEAWLRDEVASAYDAVVADPSRTVTAQAVRARLATEHAGSM